MQSFNDVDGLALSADDKNFLDYIREKVFKLSFRASGNSDIAGRVSDDIELISKVFWLANRIVGRLRFYGTSIKRGLSLLNEGDG